MKAILVVDMPSSCSRCIIFDDNQLLCCGSKVSHKESLTMRPSTCPLIQAPARKEERVTLSEHDELIKQTQKILSIADAVCIDTGKG